MDVPFKRRFNFPVGFRELIINCNQAAAEYLMDLVSMTLSKWGKGEWAAVVKSDFQEIEVAFSCAVAETFGLF